MTRVLSLRSSTGLYGAEGVILSLLPELNRQGHQADLACIQDYVNDNRALVDAADRRGLRVKMLPCRSRLDRETVSALRRELRHRRSQVLHSHDPKSTLFALWAARETRLPVVATLHGWVDTTLAMRVYNWLEAALLRFCEAITVVAPSMKRRLRRFGISGQKIHVIDNGVDTERFSPAERPPETTVFVTVARLTPEKGLDILLDAFAQVAGTDRSAKLIVAGDGPLRDELSGHASQLGIAEQVEFLGYVNDTENVYRRGSCYVCSSHTEGMPLSVLEALSTGLPVIATSVGSLPEVLGRTGGGTVVDPGSVGDLAESMLDAHRQRSVWREKGQSGRQGILEHYSLKRQGERYGVVFRDTAEGAAA